MNQTPSRSPQQRWAAVPLRQRLRVLGEARSRIAADPQLILAEDAFGGKSPSDALTTELLPLLAGIRFLEQSAEAILKPRRPGRRGLPGWLRGVHSEVRRVPFGRVLVIGPSNYPLLLPGLQTIQALAAGNAVVWKPGTGGRNVAEAFARTLKAAGLPDGLLTVTDESIAAAESAIAAGIDKAFLTGSATSGRALLRQLAEHLVPAVVELSGCDVVLVLPGADMDRVVRALTFGVRLNRASTCMAPRRVMLVGATEAGKAQFVAGLREAFEAAAPIRLPGATQTRLDTLLQQAEASGAQVHRHLVSNEGIRPVLVMNGRPSMAVAQEDIFAPIVTLMDFPHADEAVEAQTQCSYGLTASLFGPEAECRALAERLEVGTVFINDLIFPAADPRMPFGGRRLSGFGVTQGAEGLLEMTAIQTISVQRSADRRHYEEYEERYFGFFAGLLRAIYADGLRDRMHGVLRVIREGRHLR